jgi:Kyakuja-Dileera-Zisupton transposase
MDGNNSMKRVDASGHADERVFISDYLIPPTKVDAFRDDVRTRPGTVPGNVPPFGDETTVCTEHWTVANTVSEGTVDVFEQTGGFLSTCRHAIVETLAEMRRSGEL